MLVKSGASVKEVQQLARHSDPKLTLNTYTKLGVHDLVGALDRLPAIGPATPTPETQRATGTYDTLTNETAADHQQIRQQLARESVRTGATSRDEQGGRGQSGDERKPLRIADIRDRTRHGARRCEKATSGIRTLDLRFTKAPLYR